MLKQSFRMKASMVRRPRFLILLLACAIPCAAPAARAGTASPSVPSDRAANEARIITALAVPDAAALRNAIAFLQATYGNRYPRAAEFLSRLAALEKTPDATALSALQKEALIANPLVSGHPILFVSRHQYASDLSLIHI